MNPYTKAMVFFLCMWGNVIAWEIVGLQYLLGAIAGMILAMANIAWVAQLSRQYDMYEATV